VESGEKTEKKENAYDYFYISFLVLGVLYKEKK